MCSHFVLHAIGSSLIFKIKFDFEKFKIQMFNLFFNQTVDCYAQDTARIRNATMPATVTTENVFAIENSPEKCVNSWV